MTGGRLTIKVFAAGELVPAFEAFDAVQRGTADCMHSTPYYWQNKAKVLSVFTTVPFGMTNYESVAWLRYGGGQALWDEIYASFGLKGFHAGSTSVQMAGWFNKEIKSAADVNGLKMRIPGPGRRGAAQARARPSSTCRSARSSARCSPARSTPPSGSARGRTSPPASTRSRSTTIGRACTSRRP